MKVAIVTGANKGIGFGIVKDLTEQLSPPEDWTIILTARNVQLGEAAAKELANAPVKVVFQQLEITNAESIERFTNQVKTNYSGIDILVHNAGILFNDPNPNPFSVQAELTLETNFWGTLNVNKALMPLLNTNARLVFVSGGLALLALSRVNDALYAKFTSPMTVEELEQLMKDFVEHAQAGDHAAFGWPNSAYGVSKLGMSKLAFILHENSQNDSRNLVINTCCPGFTDTDMTGHRGVRTVAQAADTPVYLATLPLTGDIPKGKFLIDRVEHQWGKLGRPIMELYSP